MPSVHVVLIAYALDLTPLVCSIDGVDTIFHIFLHSTRDDVVKSCDVLGRRNNVLYMPYGKNRGLSRSWNEGLSNAQRMNADVMIIANDDVTMTRNDLLILANGAYEHREAGMVICRGYNGPNRDYINLDHVIFAVNPVAIEKVGYFDVNYYPLYGEDVDYSYRCGLAGVPYWNAGDTNIVHRGSSSIRTVPELNAQNQATFPANEQYHCRKWGGGYGRETYIVPFNDISFNSKIEVANMTMPYPGFNRTDLDIVKV